MLSSSAFIISFALILDALLGEPKKYHPLVGFGRSAAFLESKFNHRDASNTLQFIMGALCLLVLVLPFVFVTYALIQFVAFTWFWEALILYWAIGHQSLRQHILDVYQALREDDIVLARKRVAMIVSRDTDNLSEQQLFKATIETGLENGADAIFSPIFWFCLLGAPGVVLYRLINTLDAMWGYRTERFEYFGKAAARLDDVLNWFPARLVALSYAILGNCRQALNCWQCQSPSLKSPNAGPVMTSGAGSLDVQLGGPTVYHGELMQKTYFGSEKDVKLDDIPRCLSLILQTIILWCVVIGFVTLIASIWS